MPNELLFAAGWGFDTASTLTIQSPFTDASGTGARVETGWNVATTVTGYTVSYSSNNVNWYILLAGLRPTPSSGAVEIKIPHRVQIQ